MMPRKFRAGPQIVQPAVRARALTFQAAQRAARARVELIVVIPLIAGLLALFHYREQVLGVDTPARVATAIALVILGWRLARDIGRSLAPALFRRMDPATAGTVGFIIRLGFLIGAVLVALNIAGLEPRTLAVSGAIVAVVFGLAVPADAGQPDRGRRADLGPPVQGRRPRPAPVRPPRRRARGRRRLARPALHDLRPRRGLDHGPEQHRPRGRGRAAARALGRRPPRPPAPGRDAERGPGAARAGDPHARPRRAAHRPRGDRQARGRRPHRRDAGRRRRRPAARRRDPHRDRAHHPRRADRGAPRGADGATTAAARPARARRRTRQAT